jgi:superfamily II DNA/RNA helicase
VARKTLHYNGFGLKSCSNFAERGLRHGRKNLMLFSELGLSEKVLKAVTGAGYTQPTPIQEKAIPHVLARKDVLGIAQTGTGKTAAFTLPMLTLLEQGRARARMPRTLILEPTRELAAQVEENFNKYGAEHKLSVALLIGGVSFGDQDAKITRGVDVLIATPGRLLDHFERGKLLMTGIEVLVIDEADRMLDMGFIPDIERICKLTPFTRQTLFFTATMPPEIQRITEQFLSSPVRVEVSKPATAATTITQLLVASGSKDFEKRETLRRILRNSADLKNAIIFCNRKRDIATVVKSLEKHGFNVGGLHGDMDQRARMAMLEAFKAGRVPLLVASDVAARGLDIPEVSHVINYDIPIHADDYVHRIGRTGRAGRTGTAYSIASKADDRYLAAITALLKKEFDWDGGVSLAEYVPPDSDDSSSDGGRRSPRGERSRPERAARGRARAAQPPRDTASETEGERAPKQSSATPSPRQESKNQDSNNQDSKSRRNRSQERSAPGTDRSERPAKSTPAEAGNTAPAPRKHYADQDLGPAVKGMGDHMPGFLMTPVRKKTER